MKDGSHDRRVPIYCDIAVNPYGILTILAVYLGS